LARPLVPGAPRPPRDLLICPRVCLFVRYITDARFAVAEKTSLSCLAVLDGAPAADTVAYVRQHYSPDAVETLEQASFVADFR
jgi:hypothetical protein